MFTLIPQLSLFAVGQTSRRFRSGRRRRRARLTLELLEARDCPSSGSLLVGSFDNNGVLSYDETTGAFVEQFDPQNLANLKTPTGGIFGPDGNLYVTSGVFAGNNQSVLQYNGITGAFQSTFATQNITSPRGVLFGPDGNLYVADGNDAASGDPASVERFDGKTGAFLNYFVAPGSGGLEHPSYVVFGPDGTSDGKLDLYVAATHVGTILRYDGTTGAFKGVFVAVGSGGLDAPQGVVFGPNGNLFVASGNWFTSSNGPAYTGDFPPGAVLQFEGPSGSNPGAFLGTFVPGRSGGLANPTGIVFGPDPVVQGATDLYVTSSALRTGIHAQGGTSQVLRYDATTGAFLGTFVAPSASGLKFATFITFTETNATTLNYTPTSQASVLSTVLSTAGTAGSERVYSAQLASHPPVFDLGLGSGSAIRFYDAAVSSGWFIGSPSGDSREFSAGAPRTTDFSVELPNVPEYELGQQLQHEREAEGLMDAILVETKPGVPLGNAAAAFFALFTIG
jgi:DNA-binding beta-propeller fold protein YncE